MTGIGSVAVRQPRVRDREAVGGERIRLSETILLPDARRTKSLEMLIPILYLKGISTGDLEEALPALLGKDADGLVCSDHCAAGLVGGSDAALVIDDTAIPKKGKHSVGVAPQICSALGKPPNCQTLVSLTLARRRSTGHVGVAVVFSRELDDLSASVGTKRCPADIGWRGQSWRWLVVRLG